MAGFSYTRCPASVSFSGAEANTTVVFISAAASGKFGEYRAERRSVPLTRIRLGRQRGLPHSARRRPCASLRAARSASRPDDRGVRRALHRLRHDHTANLGAGSLRSLCLYVDLRYRRLAGVHYEAIVRIVKERSDERRPETSHRRLSVRQSALRSTSLSEERILLPLPHMSEELWSACGYLHPNQGWNSRF